MTSALLVATSGAAWAQSEAETGLALYLSGDEEILIVDGDETYTLDTIQVRSYEDEVLQGLGTSTIGAQEISEQPVTNDISEIVRKMPGVNLTGASASGQRGNQRQIDIRGMGPENTLILIDGKPVLSRNSVKMGRAGERDTRGDSNWVPAEMIERIEVIRGPAAARYGSGAAGGVVNIITKAPQEDTFTVSAQYDTPESDLEGDTRRLNVLWAKPLSETLTFQLTGNYNKTDGDSADRNAEAAADETCYSNGAETPCRVYAGSEGVVNKDVKMQLRWEPDDFNRIDFDFGYSRQGNIFANDSQLGGSNDYTTSLVGTETNVMQRSTAALTHYGSYGWGESFSYIQYEHTDNWRLGEGASGGGEGQINENMEPTTTLLDNVTAKTEFDIWGELLGRPVTYTLGGELRYERIDDQGSIDARGDIDFDYGDTVSDASQRDPILTQTNLAYYGEANWMATDRLDIAASARLDWADTFGSNISGGINASYQINDAWTAKFGAARAFKAPNVYQLSPNYIYTTRGNGCPEGVTGPCYVLGNSDLEAETSMNYELGLAYSGANGFEAAITAFYNNYRNKIQAGTEVAGVIPGACEVNGNIRDCQIFQWENIPEAVVGGVEGSFTAPLSETLALSTNFTWMPISENKSTGNRLSLVPDYTINASLEWQVNDRWTVIPALTHYGRTQAAEYSVTTGDPVDAKDLRDVDPYTIVNVSTRYETQSGLVITGGVTNLFDTSVDRTGFGAETYNEPGRAYYVGLSKTF
ncbi:FepA family TonB-dependent siderophore receptor [Oceanicola sp. S124]|uniref:FepA family TonB-dependent siderophore receptor n=1 Tax=Oceanicola sp. S124 TaxID=1042378 RepID=UPI00143BEB83|nr:FepA family TonB-dependent siderophore receptor [Oceanicola sp. S124]